MSGPVEQQLETAHVLFTDVVAYSKLPLEEKKRTVDKLNEMVRGLSEFQTASAENRLIRLPTGDGMALVFFGEPEAPLRAAVELARLLREHPTLKLRMGIHSGPVYRVEDINANRNVAGGGIDIAQRVMDCGDAGHILVSRETAQTFTQHRGKRQGRGLLCPTTSCSPLFWHILRTQLAHWRLLQ